MNLPFPSLEKMPAISSSLWKSIACGAVLAGLNVRGEDAVSALELIRLSRVAVAETNLTDALNLAQAAVLVDPSLADAWKQQGRVEMLAEKSTAAIGSLETALTLRPNDPDIPVWKLWVTLDLNYFRDVASQLAARDDETLVKLGEPLVARTLSSLLWQDFNDDALKLATRWQGLVTNDSTRVATGVFIQMAKGDTTGATAALEKISAGNSTAKDLLANAWLHVGRARDKNGDKEGAKAAYNKALEILPGWKLAIQALAGPKPTVQPLRRR